MEGWTEFFLAEVGAPAALGGLLFVGVAINLERILAFAGLPERALQALVILMALMTVGLLILMGDLGAINLLGVGVCLGFVKAVADAWILLVEIKR